MAAEAIMINGVDQSGNLDFLHQAAAYQDIAQLALQRAVDPEFNIDARIDELLGEQAKITNGVVRGGLANTPEVANAHEARRRALNVLQLHPPLDMVVLGHISMRERDVIRDYGNGVDNTEQVVQQDAHLLLAFGIAEPDAFPMPNLTSFPGAPDIIET